MNVLKEILFSQESGWCPSADLLNTIELAGFKITELPDNNHSDGYFHQEFSIGKESFTLKANVWKAKTFLPLIEWIDELILKK